MNNCVVNYMYKSINQKRTVLVTLTTGSLAQHGNDGVKLLCNIHLLLSSWALMP